MEFFVPFLTEPGMATVRGGPTAAPARPPTWSASSISRLRATARSPASPSPEPRPYPSVLPSWQCRSPGRASHSSIGIGYRTFLTSLGLSSGSGMPNRRRSIQR
jgi:hypothetical protein